jgi:8-oxo-dGTP pyrophosphatase MutT (NUDIX family)
MINPELDQIGHHYAGVLIETEDGRLIGQQRDDKPGIDNPGRVGTFGGAVEAGEDPQQAAWRELVQEETNLKLAKNALHLFLEDTAIRDLNNEIEARHFYFVKITNDQLSQLEVYEGQGWVEITGPADPMLIDSGRSVIEAYINQRESKLSQTRFPS